MSTLFRVEDLEIRYSEINKMYELVRWEESVLPKGTFTSDFKSDGKLHTTQLEEDTQKETCYVVCFFEQNHKEPDVTVRYVSNRPFVYYDQELMQKMIKVGYEMVYAITDMESEL